MRLMIASLLIMASGFASAEYLAYSVTEKGRAPLPERIDEIEAKHLLNIEWGEYAGRRTRAGVLEVGNDSTASTYKFTDPTGGMYQTEWDPGGGTVPVNGIEAIVTDTMNRTGRFRLVERAALGSVLGEQDLATSGRVAQPSAAATGQVLGAEILVQVVITDYEADTSGTSGGAGGLLRKVPLVGGVGIKRGKGRVGLNFRLIDATTSEVLYTKQVESIIKQSGLTLSGGGWTSDAVLGGFIDSYAKTPIGQAVIAGINKGVYDLIKEIGARPAEGSVVKAEGRRVWLNIGDDAVNMGDRLTVMSKGEELIDPDTGISLGSTDTALGDIEVVQVAEKFSIAQWVSLAQAPNRGDRVVSQATPPSIEYADKWKPPK
ncbi:MAG: CsgG/HfaB family protein [Woeseiaceae bacterium]|nr:CsgG/HfaB family protein [Woeseiaceae bacterium]